MLDNSLQELDTQINHIEYKDDTLIITYMDNTTQTIPYSKDKLLELRNIMLTEYTTKKQKYMNALELTTTFLENSKLASFFLLIGSFVFLYNLDIDIHNKIIAGMCFATATMIHHLYSDSLKEKYQKLKKRLKLFSYYIENIETFKNDKDYTINIEEVNKDGMTLKKLKNYKSTNDML